MLRDLQRGDDAQVSAIVALIDQVDPDILVLTDFDYDHDGLAMAAFARLLNAGHDHRFALLPNAGLDSGLDLDGDGRLGDARDAFGYGRFAGDGGMAILSRLPIDAARARNLSDVMWRDLPGARLPLLNDAPFPSAAAHEEMRLSSTGHWIVPVTLPNGSELSLMVFSATPPVFDGPEDMNGLRNRDELRLWQAVLDGHFGPAPASFIIAGNANLDPEKGDGLSIAMAEFLQDQRLQDPHPGQPNADWGPDGPGQLRVSYVLPSANWQILDAGIAPPLSDLSAEPGPAGPHHIVWVDIALPRL